MIVGCALFRDAMGYIEFALAQMREWEIPFVVLEGDSVDATYERLCAEPGLVVIKYDTGRPRWPSVRDGERTAHLGGLRNMVVERAVEEFDPTHLFWAESDIEIGRWVLPRLAEPDVDVIGPFTMHTPHQFYDIWSFRDLDGREFSPVAPYSWAPYTDEPFEVSSVGAVQLVRREVWDAGARYGGPDCDPATFCQGARARGFRVWAHPGVRVWHRRRRAA